MRPLSNVEKAVLSKAILEKRKVTLVVVNTSARVRPFYKCAVEFRGELVTGAEYIEELFNAEELKANKKFFDSVKKASADVFIVSEEIALKTDGDRTPPVVYQNGMSFDLSDPIDVAKYLRLFVEDDVALSKVAVNSAQHAFYIEDKAAEASHKLASIKNKAKALDLLETRIEQGDKNAVIALLKLGNVSSMTEAEKDFELYKTADTQPSKIINLLNDQQFNKKLILQKLILNKSISYNPSNGQYKVGDALVAADFDQLIKWSESEHNQQLFNELIKTLGSKATA